MEIENRLDTVSNIVLLLTFSLAVIAAIELLSGGYATGPSRQEIRDWRFLDVNLSREAETVLLEDWAKSKAIND